MANEMVTPKKRAKEPYPITADFERMTVALGCKSQPFFGLITKLLDEDCLRLPSAKLALRAAKQIDRETGRGPSGYLHVIQRIKRWMGEGNVTQDDLVAVNDLFDIAEDSGIMDGVAIAAELAPILKRRVEKEALDVAMTEFQRKGDMSRVGEMLDRASRIGVSDTSVGVDVGSGSFELLEKLRHVKRLSTGVSEIDDVLSGGAHRGTLNMWVAGTGGGKSMGLIQNATASALRGFNVGLATLELPETTILARIKANLTGVPIDQITDNPLDPLAMGRLSELQSVPSFGRIKVKKFSPKATRVGDLFDWVKASEESWGQPMSVLVIDYADKLVNSADPSKENTYVSTGDIYEDLRMWAENTDRWIWTGSQSRRSSEKKNTRCVASDDVADSMNKIRVADLSISINGRDQNTSVLFHIMKNRHGVAERDIGPLPCEYECARVGPITWPLEYGATIRAFTRSQIRLVSPSPRA